MSASTIEVPRTQWQTYFDDVNRRYQGWEVSIEIMGRDIGDQPAAEALPLQGFSYEREGSEAGDILIEAGDVGTLISHHVDHPRSVRFIAPEPGGETDIQIESDDGTATLVHLRPNPPVPAS